MKRIARFLGAAAVAIVTTMAMATPAQAGTDVVVSNGYADGGFISYGDYIWVSSYEGYGSYVKWSTDYGRTGTCGATLGDLTCDENMAEGRRITIRVCTYTSHTGINVVCSSPVSGKV